MVGPPRPSDESGGALGALDAALESNDQPLARDRLHQIEQSLRLLDAALTWQPPRPPQQAQQSSDATYQLALIILAAQPSSPAREDSVLADALGTLDAIAQLTNAFAAGSEKTDLMGATTPPSDLKVRGVERRVAALRARIEERGLSDRAGLVMEAARIGDAVRQLASGVSAPYARRTTGMFSAFALPAPRVAVDDARADLGRDLFRDKRLSRGRVRSCASCHVPERGYSDGLRVPRSLDEKIPLKRNTPTVLYAALQSAQLWDGRVHTPETQAVGVIHARAEMGLEPGELVQALAGDEKLAERFRACFADGVTAANVAAALGAFEARDLVPGRAPIDRFAAGDEGALNAEQRAGLDVFAGKGRCTRCHVPPSFGGSRPPDFAVPIYGVLGLPSLADAHVLDDDLGRGALTHRQREQRAFKTPTLRNLALTAPYMHHGVFATLEQVIDFYDRGGGSGAGLAVPNQDPDVRKLDLTAAERHALLVFLREALRDR